jgi:SAM-dependent methyltransferase
MPKQTAGQTHPGTGVVDAFVDEAYLEVCAHAWDVTRDLARSVLTALGTHCVDPADDHRVHCVNWLRQAANYRMPARYHRSAPPPSDVLAPTVDLLRHAAEAYPRFLRGAATGRQILFSGEGMALWNGYFQTGNALYRPLNAGAAAAVTQLLSRGEGGRVLEVGAGTGGATAHLLTTWPGDLSGAYEYTVTDTSASLLVNTRRTLAARTADVRLDFRRFDFDLDRDQGLTPGSFDVVLAVNAVHNAADLPWTLRALCSLLRPGGSLVLSESLCASPDLVHQEFLFNLLPLPPDAYRRRSRFFAAAAWRAHFDAAGLTADIRVNSLGPELVMVAVATPETGP